MVLVFCPWNHFPFRFCRWRFDDFHHSVSLTYIIFCGEYIEPLFECLAGVQEGDKVNKGLCIGFISLIYVIGNLMVGCDPLTTNLRGERHFHTFSRIMCRVYWQEWITPLVGDNFMMFILYWNSTILINELIFFPTQLELTFMVAILQLIVLHSAHPVQPRFFCFKSSMTLSERCLLVCFFSHRLTSVSMTLRLM